MSQPPNELKNEHSTARQQEWYDQMNVALSAAHVLAWSGLLLAMTHTSFDFLLLVEVYFFCLMMQGVFSMMHECFHGHGHRSRRVNYAMGWLASTLFGASTTFIKVNHLGHHLRNRTEAEMVDYVGENESRAKKTIAYYLAIAGGIWLGAFVGSLLIALVPTAWLERLQRRSKSNTYAAALGDFTQRDFRAIRVEVAASVLFWMTAWWLLNLNVPTVLVAYVAFAMSWSSLQWIYHVRTPLDVVEGTYNLRASKLVRLFFLNFNYNLTHHRHPGLRWQTLHRSSNLSETRPFWRTWLGIVRPPVPLPDDTTFHKTYY